MSVAVGTAGEGPAPMPPGRRYALSAVVLAASLMQVLDVTIVNVSLPHIQGSLAATQDAIAWVLTSYAIAVALTTPLVGWLESLLGRRALFLIAITGFTLTSIGCGGADSLPLMVAMRLAQGFFGASLTPLCQAVMLDIYPVEQRPKAMMIWGMGVMVGPILGPLLGGYLTETFSWRWCFLINIPIGVLAIAGGAALLPRTRASPIRLDLVGFALLATALGCFQLILDRGTQQDWFDSVEILVESGIAAACLWMFVVHSLTARNPVVPLAVLRDRNLIIAGLFLATSTGVSMAGAALIAPMMQRLMHYGVIDAGIVMAPRGAGVMLSMWIAGRLIGRIDGRFLIAAGLACCGYAQFSMTGFDLEMDRMPIMAAGLIQGIGLGFIMLPLNLLAFATLDAAVRTEGAAFYSLLRNIGGSIAIAASSALFARNFQVSHADLTTYLAPQRLLGMPFDALSSLDQASTQGVAMLELEVGRQAQMVAYLDAYLVMGWAIVVLAPLALFLRVGKPAPGVIVLAE